MTTPTPTCPECGGPLLANHPAGPLVFRHDTLAQCPLQAKEDATLVADKDRGTWFERPTTDTEKVLLAAAGVTVASSATCLVQWLSPGVRRRTWLAS